MKKSLSLPLIFCFCVSSLMAYSKAPALTENDSLLHNAQNKVLQAFVNGQMSGDAQALQQMATKMEGLYKETDQALAGYWLAYNYYYTTLFYMLSDQETEAKSAVKKGITILQNIDDKNSEHYALLAQLQSLSIRFYSVFKAISISSKVNKNGQKALQMDPENLRAHLVLGSSDYYKPTKYGGGKKVEDYLLKALDLPDQKVANPYLPSWGKNTAYEILIRFYLREKRTEDAKAMYKRAIKVYPNDYQINSLAKQLID